ncbi:MAG: hypothetical protein IJB15_05790 [Clostridia bacterium]|nr:hypothetical protein [Clostridia bacterium]
MFDIWIGDTNLTWLIIVISVLLVFPIQLFLCYKAKSLLVRLIPAGLSLLSALVSFVLMLVTIFFKTPALPFLLFIFFLIYAGGMMFFCGLAWLLWAVFTHLKKKKQ